MDQDPRGQRILKDAGMLRFAAVSDRDYDSIREMERIATSVEFNHYPKTAQVIR